MSSKTVFSTVVAVVLGATVLITGQAFAATTPTPKPAESVTATPAPVPSDRAAEPPAASAPRPVRADPNFTG